MGMSADQVMRCLTANHPNHSSSQDRPTFTGNQGATTFSAYRDAAIGPCTYQLQVVDCIRAVARGECALHY